jgi:hypothetical protein
MYIPKKQVLGYEVCISIYRYFIHFYIHFSLLRDIVSYVITEKKIILKHIYVVERLTKVRNVNKSILHVEI